MALEDSIFDAIGTVSGITIDGVAGFVPIVAIGRYLLNRGELKDLGRGEPTRRQLISIRSAARYRPDLFEVRVIRGRTCVKIRYRNTTVGIKI